MKGYNIMEKDGCFVMNFGHQHYVPYPAISWSFEKNSKFNVGTLVERSIVDVDEFRDEFRFREINLPTVATLF